MRVEKERTQEGLKIQIWLSDEELALYDSASVQRTKQEMSGEGQNLEKKDSYCLVRRKTREPIFITSSMFQLGREHGKVDYCISDNPSVSRIHAAFLIQGEQVFLVNTAAKNHTYVNGQQIPDHARILLSPGDRICLANEEFIFCLKERCI